MRKNIFLAMLVFCLLVLLVGGYVHEFRLINLALGIGPLMASSAITGAILGVAVAWLLRSRYSEAEAIIRLFSVAVISGALSLPLLASLTNRLLSADEPPRPVIFEAEQPFYSNRLGLIKGEVIRPNGYFLFFYQGEQLHRITIQKSIGEGHTKGDTLMLPIRQGFLGVDWVEVQ